VLLKRGAEADLWATEFLGRKAVAKRRTPRSYRHPLLDKDLRVARLKQEAKLIAEARRAGVTVPVIYDVDLESGTLTLQWIAGPTLKEALQNKDSPGEALLRRLGDSVGRLHARDVVHGDLTTSNVLVQEDRLCLIDFSLGEKTPSLESKGVDLRLLREALESAHEDRERLFAAFVEGYKMSNPQADEVLNRMKEIQERARYA